MPMNGQPERHEVESEDDKVDLDVAPGDAPEDGKDIEATLAELTAKADDNLDRYLRASAEVENVRKRAIRDVEHARKFALENFARELLVKQP